jgi:hypothetical protein
VNQQAQAENKIAFTCPRCAQKLRTDAARLEAEITCPKCQLVFTPENCGQSTSRCGTAGASHTATAIAQKFETAADTFRQLAFIAGCVVIICLGGAALSAIQEKESPGWILGLWLASAAAGVALLFWFASQLFAIRAHLCRLNAELRDSEN